MNAQTPFTTETVPHNIEAEQALLGAIFVNNNAFHRVSAGLRAEHFYEGLHAEIYQACADLIGRGRVATPVTVKALLPAAVTEDVSTPEYLARLAASATTIINAPDYAKAIYEASVRRQLIEVAEAMAAGASDQASGLSSGELVEDAEQRLFAIAQAAETRRPSKSFSEIAEEAMTMAAAAYRRDGGLSGLATGLSDLDRMMGGLQASDLIIIAARPGIGKTSLATNISFNVASKYQGTRDEAGVMRATSGGRVLFYSLEMSGEQLATRIIADQTGVPSSVIRRGDIREAQFSAMADTAASLRSLPLTVEDAGGITIAQLCASARRHARQKGVDLIVVDYIQLLSGTTRRSGENRVQEVTEITTKLKALAKELNVPVLALSQLSRQVEARDDKHPQLSDLRESGSIEQDADVVLFIYREEYYLAAREPKEGTPKHLEWQAEMEAAHGQAELLIAKQRHGPTGTVRLHFDASLTRFSSLANDAYMPVRR